MVFMNSKKLNMDFYGGISKYGLILFTVILSATFVYGSNSSSSCGVTVSLKVAPSDPAFQSGINSIFVTNPLDATIEYICSAGSGYDSSGIACYVLKCPSPLGYGLYGGGPGGGQYGPMYGGPQQQRGIYGQPPGPYPPGKDSASISVGGLVAQVETAYPCWKLRLLRLNTYVYLFCFVKNYESVIYIMNFKENNRIELVQDTLIPIKGASSISRATITTDQQYSCLAVVIASISLGHQGDPIREPSDLFAPIYFNCPKNYKWYFCGNLGITSTVDISILPVGQKIHAFAISCAKVDAVSVSASLMILDAAELAANVSLRLGFCLIARFEISLDIEVEVCTSRPKETLLEIGCPLLDINLGVALLYPLCGVQKSIIVASGNLTLLVVTVNVLLCPILSLVPGRPAYSSFAVLYDTGKGQIDPTKVVFFEHADQATDIQFVNLQGDKCQLLIINSVTGPISVFCLSSVVLAINNMTQSCDRNPAVVIGPVSVTIGASLFHSASSCSYKGKCCGTHSTCMTCTRPAKYGANFLAEIVCGNGGGSSAANYDDNESRYPIIPRNPYGLPPNPYGRPYNLTGGPVGPYGPQLPQGNYLPSGPYLLPPTGPYSQPPQQQQGGYGGRYQQNMTNYVG